ncbi:MAG: serine hydrolase [Ekhidna sp.]
MKKYILLLIPILCSCHDDELNPQSLNDEIEILVKTHMIHGRIPGAAIGVINNGEVSEFFYGTKDLSTGEPSDDMTYFQIASITKTMTATMIAELVTRGELDLNKPANDYLPEELQIPDQDKQPVSLQNLLNHTSGLEREPSAVEAEPYRKFDLDYLSNYLGNTSLNSDPGMAYQYSNTGYGLAGQILSRYYGKPYKEVINDQLFARLNMDFSFCDWDEVASNNIAVDYFGAKPAEYDNYSEPFAGAYVVKTNLHDMMLYLDNMINKDQSVFKDAIELSLLPTFDLEFKNKDKVKSRQIGLGWITYNFTDGKQYVYHDGALMGSSSFIGYNPESKEGVVVLINSFCPGSEQDVIGAEILDLLEEY